VLEFESVRDYYQIISFK